MIKKLIKLIGFILLFPAPSWASNEVYTAVDQSVKSPQFKVEMIDLGSMEKKQVQVKSILEAEKEHFDAVPKSHTDSISNRLKIIDQLIRKHQRAYDYRTHTTQELKNILSKLDQKK